MMDPNNFAVNSTTHCTYSSHTCILTLNQWMSHPHPPLHPPITCTSTPSPSHHMHTHPFILPSHAHSSLHPPIICTPTPSSSHHMHTHPFTLPWYGGCTEVGYVGSKRSRVWWVKRGAGWVWWVYRGSGYGGYIEEQGMECTQRSRVWWVHRGAGYGGYTEEQGMVVHR